MSAPNATSAPASRNQLALLQKDLVGAVENKVVQYVNDGALQLPPNYSVANAMKSAWLILQETVDRDKHPVLQSCTRDSIANALLDMAVQGLNPAKKQCYFIAYGKQLTLQRSYQGAAALAKRVLPTIAEIYAEVVYEGDTLRYKIERGRKVILEHEQAIGNVDKQKIVAAYAEVVNREGEVTHCVLKTIEEIFQAWGQSRQNPFTENGSLKASSVHGKFTADMCKRTVINAVCKGIINSSDDSSLLAGSLARTARAADDAELEDEIQQNGLAEELTVDPPAEPASETAGAETPAEQKAAGGPGW